MSKKNLINLEKLPQHVAVIMDGNGRWAKQNGRARVFGHQNGVKSVREITETAAELGVPYLTLYAFSTENWNRPSFEVSALMELLVRTLGRETKTLMENDIKLNAIGQLDKLPGNCHRELQKVIDATAQNKRMTLTLALSYSSRAEIVDTVKQIAEKITSGTLALNQIDEQAISNHLYTANTPDPELVIRTSGEQRISNYLLWQIAYAELYFTDTLWPDFRKEDFYEAIVDFQQRERRFGKISEQISLE